MPLALKIVRQRFWDFSQRKVETGVVQGRRAEPMQGSGQCHIYFDGRQRNV